MKINEFISDEHFYLLYYLTHIKNSFEFAFRDIFIVNPPKQALRKILKAIGVEVVVDWVYSPYEFQQGADPEKIKKYNNDQVLYWLENILNARGKHKVLTSLYKKFQNKPEQVTLSLSELSRFSNILNNKKSKFDSEYIFNLKIENSDKDKIKDFISSYLEQFSSTLGFKTTKKYTPLCFHGFNIQLKLTLQIINNQKAFNNNDFSIPNDSREYIQKKDLIKKNSNKLLLYTTLIYMQKHKQIDMRNFFLLSGSNGNNFKVTINDAKSYRIIRNNIGEILINDQILFKSNKNSIPKTIIEFLIENKKQEFNKENYIELRKQHNMSGDGRFYSDIKDLNEKIKIHKAPSFLIRSPDGEKSLYIISKHFDI